MKSREISIDKVGKRMSRGFTIVELLIVLGIGVLMAVAVTPIYSNLVPASDSTQVASEIIQTIRIARARSVARLEDSSFGVKFLPNQYVLYKGASYATGVPERTISLGSAFTVSTTFIADDINFSRGLGVSNAGLITLSHQATDPKVIDVNQFGMAEVK